MEDIPAGERTQGRQLTSRKGTPFTWRTREEILAQLLANWFTSIGSKFGPGVGTSITPGEYSKTGYGAEKGVQDVTTLKEFAVAFPVLDYEGYAPMVERAFHGDPGYLCSGKPLAYVMTRGTRGKSKVVPCTQPHLDRVFECGARELICQAYRTEDSSLLEGYVLNLNFPSVVTQVPTAEGVASYGYSSGTYARLKPTLGSGGLIPLQEEIDVLGPGISSADWRKRFDLAYERTKGLPVVAVMGVSPVILAFGRHVKGRYHRAPKEIWKMKALFCTSVAKIHQVYGPQLQRLFGKAPVREIYSATEGVFAQQLDSYPYIVPNYDEYLFEVKVGRGTIPLHTLRRGEWGRLIVSTPVFPRYDIGDMIECLGPNYFRVFGRARMSVILEHMLYRAFASWSS